MKEIPDPKTGFEPISQMIRGYLEYLDLLKKCGFVEKDIIHLPTSSNPAVIIVARKNKRGKGPHKSP